MRVNSTVHLKQRTEELRRTEVYASFLDPLRMMMTRACFKAFLKRRGFTGCRKTRFRLRFERARLQPCRIKPFVFVIPAGFRPRGIGIVEPCPRTFMVSSTEWRERRA